MLKKQLSSLTKDKQYVPALVIGWVTASVKLLIFSTPGSVILNAAFLRYSITGWEMSIFMRGKSATTLHSRPMRG